MDPPSSPDVATVCLCMSLKLGEFTGWGAGGVGMERRCLALKSNALGGAPQAGEVERMELGKGQIEGSVIMERSGVLKALSLLCR